ncbi:hypothetical protein ACS386_09290 [Flavobacteriaceae bacterium LMO-SS05]
MKRILKIIGFLLIAYLLLAFVFPRFFAIPIASWNSRQMWKKAEEKQQISNRNEISSFELNVVIYGPNSDFKDDWKTELKNMGLDIEFYPDLNEFKHMGYFPVKVKMVNPTHNYLKNECYESGFELMITDFDSEDFFKYLNQTDIDNFTSKELKLYKNAKFQLFFEVNPKMNISEFRTMWYMASTITKLYNGILTDTYTGKEYFGDESESFAVEITKQFESNTPDKDWNLIQCKN